MNNLQLSILLTQYLRALDVGLDQACSDTPEYKTRLVPLYAFRRDVAVDIEKLEQSALMTMEPPASDQPQPRKGKDVITFEGDHICINGSDFGVHDLLMYARAILKKGVGDIGVARLKVDLEDVIENNQRLRGVEVYARMPELANGDEV